MIKGPSTAKDDCVGRHDALTEKIIGVFYQVLDGLGFGFAESIYGRSMAIALEQIGLSVATECGGAGIFPRAAGWYVPRGPSVERKVILEFKTADRDRTRMRRNCCTTLRASTIEVGMVMNFW